MFNRIYEVLENSPDKKRFLANKALKTGEVIIYLDDDFKGSVFGFTEIIQATILAELAKVKLPVGTPIAYTYLKIVDADRIKLVVRYCNNWISELYLTKSDFPSCQ